MTSTYTIRGVDLELAGAIIEKERLLVAATRHDAVMRQDSEIERLIGLTARLRGMSEGQLTLGVEA